MFFFHGQTATSSLKQLFEFKTLFHSGEKQKLECSGFKHCFFVVEEDKKACARTECTRCLWIKKKPLPQTQNNKVDFYEHFLICATGNLCLQSVLWKYWSLLQTISFGNLCSRHCPLVTGWIQFN